MNRRDAESAEGAEKRRKELDRVSGSVVDAAVEVHRTLGAGLLESLYEQALAVELDLRGCGVRQQVRVPVSYKRVELGRELVIDMIVDDLVIVEVKSVRSLDPVHGAQLLSFLRLTQLRVGLLLNFNVVTISKGIRRFVNGY